MLNIVNKGKQFQSKIKKVIVDARKQIKNRTHSRKASLLFQQNSKVMNHPSNIPMAILQNLMKICIITMVIYTSLENTLKQNINIPLQILFQLYLINIQQVKIVVMITLTFLLLLLLLQTKYRQVDFSPLFLIEILILTFCYSTLFMSLSQTTVIVWENINQNHKESTIRNLP